MKLNERNGLIYTVIGSILLAAFLAGSLLLVHRQEQQYLRAETYQTTKDYVITTQGNVKEFPMICCRHSTQMIEKRFIRQPVTFTAISSSSPARGIISGYWPRDFEEPHNLSAKSCLSSCRPPEQDPKICISDETCRDFYGMIEHKP